MVDPTLWMLMMSNLFMFAIGGALTYLSLQARRRVGKSNLNYTLLGFCTRDHLSLNFAFPHQHRTTHRVGR